MRAVLAGDDRDLQANEQVGGPVEQGSVEARHHQDVCHAEYQDDLAETVDVSTSSSSGSTTVPPSSAARTSPTIELSNPMLDVTRNRSGDRS